MTLRLSEEEYAELMRRRKAGRATTSSDPSEAAHLPLKGKARATKYGNRRTEVDGKRFDSAHEAEVYAALMLRVRAGELRLVLRQVSFDLPGNIRYVADFVTVDCRGNLEIIDAKSEATRKNRVYINKKKQLLEVWGCEIREV